VIPGLQHFGHRADLPKPANWHANVFMPRLVSGSGIEVWCNSMARSASVLSPPSVALSKPAKARATKGAAKLVPHTGLATPETESEFSPVGSSSARAPMPPTAQTSGLTPTCSPGPRRV
jgi:hypothetical protein